MYRSSRHRMFKVHFYFGGSGRGGQCAGLNTGRLPDKPTLYWSSGQRRRLTGICFNDSKTGVS